VEWARTTGIAEDPEWYPGLADTSSFACFQEYLFRTGKGDCTEGPCEPCADLEPLEPQAPPASVNKELDPRELNLQYHPPPTSDGSDPMQELLSTEQDDVALSQHRLSILAGGD